MGGKPSKTRKLTIENDDPTSVIKVSDELVQRLKGNQGTVRSDSVINSAGQRPIISDGSHFGPPLPFLYEPSLTSLQIRQANVAELKKNDEYWEKRINDLQTNHKKMQEIMEHEYNKAVGEVKGTKKDVDSSVKYMPPCQDNKKAVMECYKKYPNEPMRCAKEVQAFAECVDMKRATLIANRG